MDSGAATLGVKFRYDVAGTINGIRFYKGAGNAGTHMGLLYSSTGTLLGQATFTGETASGWRSGHVDAGGKHCGEYGLHWPPCFRHRD